MKPDGDAPMAKKEFRNPGKGMRPVMGYNPKKWNENFREISWREESSKMEKKLRRNRNRRQVVETW
jgi:hypothetical protein